MTDEKEPKDFDIERYMKGVNDGYLIAKYLPPLADHLARSEEHTEWFEGMREGRNLRLLEKAKENRPGFLKEKPREQTPDHTKSKDRDAEKDR